MMCTAKNAVLQEEGLDFQKLVIAAVEMFTYFLVTFTNYFVSDKDTALSPNQKGNVKKL